MMHRPACLFAALLAACSSLSSPGTAHFGAIAPQLDAARGRGDLDDALLLLDGIAADCRESPTYHALRGELTLQLANAPGRQGAELLRQDSIAALRRAIALDGRLLPPRRWLAQALLEDRQFAAAAGVAEELLARAGSDDELAAAAHALHATAAASAFAERAADDRQLLAAARRSFQALQPRLDAPLLAQWAATEALAGEPVEAVQVYVRAAAWHPDDASILDGLVTTAAEQQLLPLALLALRDRRDAIGCWYLGRVHYLLAANRPAAAAVAGLDAAMQCFRASMQQNPAYRDSCEQWLAMCLGKQGNFWFRAGDLPQAEACLLQSTRLRPDRIGEDLGGGDTTRLGLLRLGDRYMRDTQRAEAFFRAAAEAADRDLDLLNNAAVYARDRGIQLERAGQPEAARAMYEYSYASYGRAVALDPGSVRLRNDCALIAIHHLDRDWPRSKAMLEAAIADGERGLRADPPADARARRDLDEAVGDCYENLALWQLEHGGDAAAALAAATTSMQHYPKERRQGAVQHRRAAEAALAGR